MSRTATGDKLVFSIRSEQYNVLKRLQTVKIYFFEIQIKHSYKCNKVLYLNSIDSDGDFKLKSSQLHS